MVVGGSHANWRTIITHYCFHKVFTNSRRSIRGIVWEEVGAGGGWRRGGVEKVIIKY